MVLDIGRSFRIHICTSKPLSKIKIIDNDITVHVSVKLQQQKRSVFFFNVHDFQFTEVPLQTILHRFLCIYHRNGLGSKVRFMSCRTLI